MIGMIVSLGCLFFSAPALAQFGRPARPHVDIPAAPLRNIIFENCVKCHGIDDYAFFSLPRDKWKSMLADVHEGMNVKLDRKDEDLLLDYLAENFGEDSSPFPREFIPPEITEFFSEEEGRNFLDFECTECHETDRIYESRHTLARWRTLVLEMRQRGLNLPEAEKVERIAEWLSRFQGANEFE
ncbi:MAG: hypothetical protein RQ899_02865 [Pseudomonadales bacterium]|nr:hypothetical protein [Pseudomonadales bacterium]